MDALSVLNCFLYAFECVSLPPYLLILGIITRNAKFANNPFWRIVFVLSVCQICHWLIVYFFYRLPLYSALSDFFASLPESLWLGWAMFTAFFFQYMQFLLNVVIALNRLTCVCFPLRHQSFWQRTLSWWLFACVALTLGSTFDRLFTTGKFTPLIQNNASLGYVAVPVSFGLYMKNQSLWTMVVGAWSAFSCTALNLFTLLTIVRNRKKQAATGTSAGMAQHRVEWHLLLIALWTMFTQLVAALSELLIDIAYQLYLTDTRNSLLLYLVFAQTPWLVDLRQLSDPWLLLVVCSDLRRALARQLAPILCAKQQPVAVAPLPPNHNSQPVVIS